MEIRGAEIIRLQRVPGRHVPLPAFDLLVAHDAEAASLTDVVKSPLKVVLGLVAGRIGADEGHDVAADALCV